MTRNLQTRKHKRRGAAAVEFAFVLPVIFVFFFGLWEWSRVEMVRHVTETAVFSAARHGTLPGATEAEMEQVAEDILSMYLVTNGEVTIRLSLRDWTR